MAEKKVVHYVGPAKIQVGSAAWVTTIDHPGPGVSNNPDGLVTTTKVESYDPTTGIFETKNSIYKPNIILG